MKEIIDQLEELKAACKTDEQKKKVQKLEALTLSALKAAEHIKTSDFDGLETLIRDLRNRVAPN